MRESFNPDWQVQPKASIFTRLNDRPQDRASVTLPHDAMLTFERSAEHGEGSQSGYFPGGSVEYTKSYEVSEEWRNKRATVEFQGVYRDAMIFVNGVFAGQRPNGYSLFRIKLDPYLRYGTTNTIRVDARAHQDSRWYSGLGIHRDTVLVITELAHLASGGIRITTPDIDSSRAVVEVDTQIENESTGTLTLTIVTQILDAHDRIVASDTSPVTVRPGASAGHRQRMYVPDPMLWSVDRPDLYRAAIRLLDGDAEIDSASETFGIRTLQVDPIHGLRINDEVIKLRGACIHHDNGLLGAVSIGRAEERRIEILKAAGFNAIRSAHNPISPAVLEACDRLGMLVVDEAFDMWTEAKNSFDYSLAFPEWWARDVESMVAKDFNHPSVIVYSIGNEILDIGKPLGASWGRALAEKVRSLDRSRFTTNGISGFVATISELIDSFKQQAGELRSKGNVNDHMAELHHLMDQISLSGIVTEKTAESHAVVDIVGHNYAEERYLADRTEFPNRIVVGTETLANHIDTIWKLVLENPHVIGDFTWTGWDYLGEAGLGRVAYGDDEAEGQGPDFPWLLAWCGDIDITGYRRPASYYREIVFGLRHEPYIAVRRPAGPTQRTVMLGWAWTDSIGSWTWNVDSGVRLGVEVYSDAEEVELFLDGNSIGTAPAGPANRFRAEFDVEYQPGELVAVARSGGTQTTRTALRTAGPPASIQVTADRTTIRADEDDLGYLTIEVVDATGTLVTSADRRITVELAGPAVLQGLGTARPATAERYDATTCTTFDGRALAIVRPTSAGEILLTVTADPLPVATARVRIEPSPQDPTSGSERYRPVKVADNTAAGRP